MSGSASSGGTPRAASASMFGVRSGCGCSPYAAARSTPMSSATMTSTSGAAPCSARRSHRRAGGGPGGRRWTGAWGAQGARALVCSRGCASQTAWARATGFRLPGIERGWIMTRSPEKCTRLR